MEGHPAAPIVFPSSLYDLNKSGWANDTPFGRSPFIASLSMSLFLLYWEFSGKKKQFFVVLLQRLRAFINMSTTKLTRLNFEFKMHICIVNYKMY